MGPGQRLTSLKLVTSWKFLNIGTRCPYKMCWLRDQNKNQAYRESVLLRFLILTLRCSCGGDDEHDDFFCIYSLSRCCESLVCVFFCSPFSPPDSPLSARESAFSETVSSDKTNKIQLNYFYIQCILYIRVKYIGRISQKQWPFKFFVLNTSCQISLCMKQIIP